MYRRSAMWKAAKDAAGSLGHELVTAFTTGIQKGLRLHNEVTGLLRSPDNAAMLDRYQRIVEACEPDSTYPDDLKRTLKTRLQAEEAAVREVGERKAQSTQTGDWADRIVESFDSARLVRVEKLKLLLGESDQGRKRKAYRSMASGRSSTLPRRRATER
jgi:hypothetical protein